MKKISELGNEILTDKYKTDLLKLYGCKEESDSIYEYQKNRYMDAVSQFERIFEEDEVAVFSAPGRSEICGNHTDHQLGMVLATSVSADMIAVVSKRDDDTVKVYSDRFGECFVDLDNLDINEAEFGTTKALIRGVLAGVKSAGFKIGGFDAYVTSDVLSGSGLSSSAAFEVLIGTVISGLYNDSEIPSEKIATIGQFAENNYFGKPCGLMDQMACAVGGLIFIDFYNEKRVECDFTDFGYSLCITATGGSHDDLTDEYAAIPAEMKAVAAYFNKSVLREVDYDEFLQRIPRLRKEFGDRAVLRALHFFEENKRVIKAYEALKAGNIEAFLQQVKQSGDSSFKYLQNVYVSANPQNQNMSIALALSELYLDENGICRVHGGGFAGTVLALVKNENTEDYKENVEKVFGEGSCMVMNIRPYGGVKVME